MSNTISVTRRIINSILAIIFAIFTYFQHNDPDAFIWIFVYGVVSIICLIGIFRPLVRMAYYSVLIGLIVFALYHFPSVIEWLSNDNKAEVFGEMKGDRPYIEGSREFLGLMLAVGAILYQKTEDNELSHKK